MKRIFLAILALGISTQVAAEYPPATGPKQVCMVGDSITARGLAWRGFIAEVKFAEWHFKGIFSDVYYLHHGVGGDTTGAVWLRRTVIVGCDAILLLVGGNDVLYGYQAEGIADRIKQLADYFAGTGANVYVGLLIPANAQLDGTVNTFIAKVNGLIEQRIGSAYPLVDYWTAYTSSGYPLSSLFADSIHPSERGYRVLADWVLANIPE